MKDGFFKWEDEHIDELQGIYLDPGFWWSRRYEYKYAMDQLKPRDIILDAACGDIHPFKDAAADICKVYACDRINLPASDRYEFTMADITALPYPDKMFTKVFCISVLEHLPPGEISKVIKEFKRVLKPKGKLILTVDYPTCDVDRLYDDLIEAGFKVTKPDKDMSNAVSSTYFGMELFCYHLQVSN